MASHKVTWDQAVHIDYVYEAVRRVFARDGVPRHVYADGTIKKYDWQLSGPVEDIEGEALEDHIARLIEEQNGQQG